MPNTKWRDWLKIERKPRARVKKNKPKFVRPETKKERQMRMRERKMRFEIRRIAQRAMEDLILIMTKLHEVSDYPERDYARIFRDGVQYAHMVEACSHAYDLSLEGRLGLYTKENLDIFRDALSRAGLGYHGKGQLATLRARMRAVEELKQKEAKDGIPYFKELVAEIFPVQCTEVLIEKNKKLMAIWHQVHPKKPSQQPRKGT